MATLKIAIQRKGEYYDCINGVMAQYINGKPEVEYINYKVINEKPSFDFEYEF